MRKILLATIFAMGLGNVARADGEACNYDPSAPMSECPDGEMCATDNTCGAPCGVNFACSQDEVCLGGDCVPACVFTAEGCGGE